jgi:5-methylcytosine-specific restriction protein A
MCQEAGVEDEPATRVDHKVKHKRDSKLFWDEANWQPLCQPHHDLDKQRMENGGVARMEPLGDGWPAQRKDETNAAQTTKRNQGRRRVGGR